MRFRERTVYEVGLIGSLQDGMSCVCDEVAGIQR